MHAGAMQGHPGASNMLGELRKRFYIPNLAEKVQKFDDNCQDCYKEKPVNPSTLTSPIEPICEPCNGPEEILEIDFSVSYGHLMGTHTS